MNDPENFLARWSRRKHKSGADSDRNVEPGNAPTRAMEGENQLERGRDPTPTAAEFDVGQLPPIESIGAGSDISDFLRPGVPEALRHAALRRAWAADPAIRDFVGLNENYWDAAGPGGVPGFGDLDAGFDVKRLVSELFGERPSEPSPMAPEREQSPASLSSDENSPVGVQPVETVTAKEQQGRTRIPQRDENVAAQKDGERPPAQRHSRRHGGAMPQ